VAATETRSAPVPPLPRSKTTIISSAAPSGDEPATESAPTTGEAPPQCVPTPHRYNIEVSAVSEKSEADAMVGRIVDLGFKACERPRTVNGETQYAVRVGPYNTADEAAAAQEKLHEQYQAAYSEP
jgi:cell division protein FtsN